MSTTANIALPGDFLAEMIHALTGERPCGECAARRDMMNRWWVEMGDGPLKHLRYIRRHGRSIHAWLSDAAHVRSIRVTPRLIVRAMRVGFGLWIRAQKAYEGVEKSPMTAEADSYTGV